MIAALTTRPDTPVQEMYLIAASAPTARRGPATAELALADAYLRMDPFSDAATDAIPGLRARGAGRRGRRRASCSAARSPRPTTRSRRSPATRG